MLDRLPELPVITVANEIGNALETGHAILNAPPGSGKSTLVPLLLKDVAWLANKKIVMLEPRRIAARACAMRMASLLNEKAGETVGYQTRFEKKLGPDTRIEVITEGLLIRRLQLDPELSDTGLLIFDEFHERNLQGDLALALALDTVNGLRDDLRLLIMSATLDSSRLKLLLGNAPEITCSGKTYPVDVTYLKSPVKKPLAQVVVGAVQQQLLVHEGDVLVFLPAVALIKQITATLAAVLPDVIMVPLFGDLSPREQDRALFPDPDGKRKVVLTTDIAETSLTIEGISIVIDSGLAQKPSFNPNNGLTTLQTVLISRASATQRTGRAGRLKAGHCLRLWTEQQHAERKAFSQPEILAADLAELSLALLQWGVSHPDQLQWIDPPPPGHWQQAMALLIQLKAVDAPCRLTAIGKNIATLPLHPRLACLIVVAIEKGCGHAGIVLAALLSERDIFDRDRSMIAGADIEDRIAALTVAGKPSGLHRSALTRVKHAIKQYHRTMKIAGHDANSCAIAELVATVFPDRIAKRVHSNCYQLASGQYVRLRDNDPLVSADYLVIPDLDAGKREGRIYSAVALEKGVIEMSLHHLIKQSETLTWNEKNGRLETNHREMVGAIVLSHSSEIPTDSQEINAFWGDYIQTKGLACLSFSEPVKKLLMRLQQVRQWQPDSAWPDMSEEHLLATIEHWLLPWTGAITALKGIRNIDFMALFRQQLGWDKQQLLETLMPTHLTVPSGSRKRLDYTNADNPVLSVRLQELFGLMQTPCICNGSIPVVIHILSPAQRPVQITKDLESFWKNTYTEVRKDLQGRYPKHYWPKDPYTAAAIKGVRRK